MASMAFTSSSLIKIQDTNRCAIMLCKPCSPRVFTRASRTPSQASRRGGYGAIFASYEDATKQGLEALEKGVDAAKKSNQQIQDDVAAAANSGGEKFKSVTGEVSETVEDVAGKVKQASDENAEKLKKTAEEAWDNAKETNEKIKDTVVGKAEAAKVGANETIKEVAAKADSATKSD